MKPAKALLSGLIIPVLAAMVASPAFAANERPKQYVILSFDGSRSVQMWSETRELAKEVGGITVFMSGLHFLTESLMRTHYDPPGPKYGPGASAIRKIPESEKASIPNRIIQVEGALQEGIEVGSHAVGHFDAGRGPNGLNWSTADWVSEITQFQNIVLNIFEINGIPESYRGEAAAWKRNVGASLRGFRAPLLSTNGTLHPALVQMGYTWDGSEVARMGVWPYYKREGIWVMPMGSIPVIGTARTSIAMDYNFYANDSRATPDLARSQFYEDRWHASLTNYFNHSYYGNRAPIHVGAHFDDWNGRAYFTGFFKFAREVCSQPEVECVTGAQMLEILKGMGQAKIADLQAGNFPQLARPASVRALAALDVGVQWNQSPSGVLNVSTSGRDVARLQNQLRYEVKVDGDTVSNRLNDLRLPNTSGVKEVSVRIFRGQNEIQSSTRRVELVGGRVQRVELRDREERIMQGDLPGAHGQHDDFMDAAPIWAPAGRLQQI